MIKEDSQYNNLDYIVKNTLNHCHFRVHNVFNLSSYPNWQIHHR